MIVFYVEVSNDYFCTNEYVIYTVTTLDYKKSKVVTFVIMVICRNSSTPHIVC